MCLRVVFVKLTLGKTKNKFILLHDIVFDLIFTQAKDFSLKQI